MSRRILFTLALLCLLVLPATAQKLINIDFGAHTNPAFSVKTGKAATGLTDQDYWNLYSRDGAGGSFLNSSQLLNLKLSNGTVTEADLFVENAPGAWFTLNPDPMFESYLYPGNPNINIDLRSVPTGQYDIYVYAHGQPPAENSVIQLTSGPTLFPPKATSTAQNWDSLGWREDSQYVVFRNVAVNAAQPLSIVVKPGAANMSVINGIQLREVLPPTSTNSEIVIHQPPTDHTVAVGAAAELSVIALSELPLTYRWYLNGSLLANGTGAAFRIENATADHVGSYHVVISNGQKSISSPEAYLQLYLPVAQPLLNIDFGAHLNPFLHKKEGPAAFGKGLTDKWNLYSRDAADGSWLENNQLTNIVWSDGTRSAVHVAVSNAGGAWYTLHRDAMFESYLYPGSRSGPINIELQHLPAGIYDFVVYAHGQIPSENGVIELSTDSTNFGLKVTRAATNWNADAWTEGKHFVVFRDVILQHGETIRVSAKPGQSGLAVINGMQLIQKSTTPASSTITITAQPLDMTVVIGQTAEFSVSASAPNPLRYQWHFNNTIMAGATNPALRIPNVSTSAGWPLQGCPFQRLRVSLQFDSVSADLFSSYRTAPEHRFWRASQSVPSQQSGSRRGGQRTK